MTIYVGGIRARLVHDSLYAMLNAALTGLGWFNGGRQHLPVTFEPVELDNDVDIALNTLVLVDGNSTQIEAEMGSQLTDHRGLYFVDFYGENRPLAIQMSRDIQDILEGRFSAIGRTGPYFTVYDYTMATPTGIFTCQIENVIVDRTHNPAKSFQKHWYSVGFTVVDTYANDLAGAPASTLPGPTLFPSP